jgi:methionyl-tRNA synthetase
LKEGKKLYVWFDAPIGYISSTKEWACAKEKIGEHWEDQDTKLVHFIGKTICFSLHFSCDVKSRRKLFYDNVPANEFLNLEGNIIYV